MQCFPLHAVLKAINSPKSLKLNLVTHHWKYQLAKLKELLILLILGCCGPTWSSFFTHGQIKNPAFFLEIAVKTHSPFGPYFEDHFAFVPLALKKGWIFF